LLLGNATIQTMLGLDNARCGCAGSTTCDNMATRNGPNDRSPKACAHSRSRNFAPQAQVEPIVSCVETAAGARPVVYSSFDPDVCTALARAQGRCEAMAVTLHLAKTVRLLRLSSHMCAWPRIGRPAPVSVVVSSAAVVKAKCCELLISQQLPVIVLLHYG
jgi:hypothetical protein